MRLPIIERSTNFFNVDLQSIQTVGTRDPQSIPSSACIDTLGSSVLGRSVTRSIKFRDCPKLIIALNSKGTLPNYFLKISVIMTLSLGPLPPLHLSVMAKVVESHTWT